MLQLFIRLLDAANNGNRVTVSELRIQLTMNGVAHTAQQAATLVRLLHALAGG
jgi:hypothetical protein